MDNFCVNQIAVNRVNPTESAVKSFPTGRKLYNDNGYTRRNKHVTGWKPLIKLNVPSKHIHFNGFYSRLSERVELLHRPHSDKRFWYDDKQMKTREQSQCLKRYFSHSAHPRTRIIMNWSAKPEAEMLFITLSSWNKANNQLSSSRLRQRHNFPQTQEYSGKSSAEGRRILTPNWNSRPFRCPYGLTRRSAAVWLLGTRVRIPLSVSMFVVCWVGRGLCDKLITRSKESYRVYVGARACLCVI